MASTIEDEIEELKRKIALLDGDNKAYSESSQWSIRQNRNHIAQLRAENKSLRNKLAKKLTADDDVISDAFTAHGLKPPADLRGLTGEMALTKFDQMVCDLIKRFNSLEHTSKGKQQTLQSMEAQLLQMQAEAGAIAATPAGNSQEATELRQMENRLNKAVIKCNEARHIQKTYKAILQKLDEERLNFDNEIDDLQKAIKIRCKELLDLETMYNDAIHARELAKLELVKQEQSMTESRREREKVLAEHRKQAEEKKDFQDKVERRLRRMSLHQGSQEHLASIEDGKEDQDAKISSYEEALGKIKDATGVSEIEEVVERFLNQGNTRKHLQQLKEENTGQLARLREEKEKLQAQFEDMKYSGEAKMSSGQRMLEEFQTHLEEAQNKKKESQDKADRAARLVVQVKNGIEHLSAKLQHIKLPQTHMLKPKMELGSEEYILEQLSVAEQKMVNLAEELASRDLDTIKKEMEDREFHRTIESGTAENVRIAVPKAQSKSVFYDDDSGSDEDVLTREAMKKNTQALVDSKTKKKNDDEEEVGTKKRKR